MRSDLFCVPDNDPQKRYLLGQSGDKLLLAIALNPSTANSSRLDPSSKNIQAIARQQGCNGWVLANLCPLRSTNPKKLPRKLSSQLMQENLAHISALLTSTKTIKVLLCWGNGIESRDYLQAAAKAICERITEHQHHFYCLGYTSRHHPFHPSPQVLNKVFGGVQNTALKEFKFQE